MIKVQCVSTNSGFYEKLEIGKWYFAEEYSEKIYYIFESESKTKILNDYNLYSALGIYDKNLFRTLSDVRNIKITKLI
jgi:hypothetical protein